MRRGGILLHVTSLPSRGPIGDLGPAALGFLDWLRDAGCRVWQILPLNPVGPGGSPYASPSALAAEPALISIEGLIDDGLLPPCALPEASWQVDWEAVRGWKRPLLRDAARRLAEIDPAALDAYQRQNPWVADWALFSALHAREYGWQGWSDAGLRARDPAALEAARRALAPQIQEALALQLLFDRQWARLRASATERGIAILGDMPLFVSGDGCDTWAHRALFELDADGRSSVVAGAPPDAFTPDGQLWGAPCYAWDAHRAEGFAWWRRRVTRLLHHAHVARIDHFRGLAATWTIPADAEKATAGDWRPAPGADLFDALGVPGDALVAEDLGTITPDVEALRRRVGCPGMKVLQFGFGEGADHPYLPHNYLDSNWVAYTGTHDNHTARGWYANAAPHEADRFRRYVGRDGSDVAWDLIRLAWSSRADTAITPMQDALSLDGGHRMNTPGTTEGNWGWRYDNLPHWVAGRLRDLSESYGRLA